MPRGRKRKHNSTIPKHIDQALLPPGIYWDKSGTGRWYVFEPRPDGGPRGRDMKTVTVASAQARLSELHDIMEIRRSGTARGTLRWLHAQFKDSTEYRELSQNSKDDYDHHGDEAIAFKTRRGVFGDEQVDRLTTPIIQRLVEDIAKGAPESRPGAGDGREGYPSKANHILRYLRRLFAWGVRHGGCKSNPARGVKQVKERKKRVFPKNEIVAQLIAFARERGRLTPHSKGSCPPYLAAVAEIAFACRLRGIEVCDLTDADILVEGVRCRRRKGSLTTTTAWTPRLRLAVAELQARRSLIIKDKRGITPLRAEDRPLLYSEDGSPLARSSLHSAWKRLLASAVDAGVISEADEFGMHGLKRRGISNSEGTREEKKDGSGHATEQAFAIYDDEIKLVPAPVHPLEKVSPQTKKRLEF